MIETLDVVTVDDLVRAGACREGVRKVRDRYAEGRTVARVAELLLKLRSENRDWLAKAAGLRGDGYGDGYGYGSGYRDGYGSGYGYRDGYRDGDGYG